MDADEARQMVRLSYLDALLEGDARRALGIYQAVSILRPDLCAELDNLDAERSMLRKDVPPFADES